MELQARYAYALLFAPRTPSYITEVEASLIAGLPRHAPPEEDLLPLFGGPQADPAAFPWEPEKDPPTG